MLFTLLAAAACLQDAHLATGQQARSAYTWDTTINRYYGEQTTPFQARYDRVFCSQGFKVLALQLVANSPLGDGSYLSDHYGLLCTVTVPA